MIIAYTGKTKCNVNSTPNRNYVMYTETLNLFKNKKKNKHIHVYAIISASITF